MQAMDREYNASMENATQWMGDAICLNRECNTRMENAMFGWRVHLLYTVYEECNS
jgi:hypothetical protein